MALVYIRPDADEIDGNWVNQSGSNVNLYDSLNEAGSPTDADYIRSEDNPANDIVKLRLGNFGSVPEEPMTVRYRFKKVVSAGETLSMKVRLIEGDSPATTIAEWEHEDVTDAYVTEEQELTAPQFAEITDFDDLYLEFEAISGLFVAPEGALALLVGEADGFAIDATDYGDLVPAEYVGGPVGGTLAVKGHTTNYSNVPLDSGNLVQSGTSPKMVQWHEEPFIRWTPHNLQLHSEGIVDSTGGWSAFGATSTANNTTAPDGAATADKLTSDNANSNHVIFDDDSVTVLADVVYTISVYVKSDTHQYFTIKIVAGATNWFAATFDITNGIATGNDDGAGGTYISSSIEDAGNGWYRVSATGSTAGTSGELGFQFASAADPTGDANFGNDTWDAAGTEAFWLWGAQINRGHYALPYLATTSAARIGIPQAYDSDEGQHGILVEPAATNLCLRSEAFDFSGYWNNFNVTVTANDESPNGAATGDLITINSANNFHTIESSDIITSASVSYTVSVYVKLGSGSRYVLLNVTGDASGDVWYRTTFDLLTGVITQEAAGPDGVHVDASITSVGDGWFRLVMTGNQEDTDSYMSVGFSDSATPSTSGNFGTYQFTGNGTDELLVWGAQFELGLIATTYIPTVGSTATRAADLISTALSTMPFSATAGSFYADMKHLVDGTIRVLSFDDTSTAERIFLFLTSSQLQGRVDDGSVTQAAMNSGAVILDSRQQVSMAWAANDFDISLDGGTLVSDGAGTLPTMTTLYLGDGSGGGFSMTGFIYRFTYVPRQVETDG